MATGAKKLMGIQQSADAAVPANYLFAPGGSRAAIVDISDPTNMSLAATWTDSSLSGTFASVYNPDDDVVFATGANRDVVVSLDVSARTSAPTVLQDFTSATATDLNGVSGLAIDPARNVLFTSAWNGSADTVMAVDITSASSMSTLSKVRSTSQLDFPYGMALDVEGQVLYVACVSDDAITSIDVSNLNSISILDEFSNADLDGARDVQLDLANNRAYVVSNIEDSITCIDISTPSNMSKIGSLIDNTNLNGPYNIRLDLENNVAFASCFNGDSFCSIDISDPTNMSILDTLTHTDIDNPRGFEIDFATNTAYLSNIAADSIVAIDISNASNLSVKDSIVSSLYLGGASCALLP